MPNHVTHRVVVRGNEHAIARFRERCFSAVEDLNPSLTSSKFDFNRLIPMPAILEHTVSPPQKGPNGRQLLNDPTDDSPIFRRKIEATEEQQAELDALEYKDWYNWAVVHWGTKWGGYSFRMVKQEAEYLEFMFDTAWSPPVPIFEKMAVEFPDVEFEVDAFDEGWEYAYHGKGERGTYYDMSLEATDEHYEQVYGEPPQKWDEEDEAA